MQEDSFIASDSIQIFELIRHLLFVHDAMSSSRKVNVNFIFSVSTFLFVERRAQN